MYVYVCTSSTSEILVRVYHAVAKEAAQMFAPASVRRQRVTFTQHRSVGRLDVCTSIGGWLSTGEDKGDRGILLDAGYTTALSRLIEDAMMENARGNCDDSIRPLSLKCRPKNRPSISIFFAIFANTYATIHTHNSTPPFRIPLMYSSSLLF